jgi:membrane fusion protein (multidrug efflux system)
MPQDLTAAPLPDDGKPEPGARPESDSKPPSNVPPSPRRRKRGSWRNGLFILVGFTVIVAGGLFLWRYLTSYESTDDAQVDAHLHPVSARIRGHVIRVNVDDNQWVKKGTVLVEIDPRDYQVAVDQAKADLATAEATAQSVHIDVPITSTNTSSQIDAATADVNKNRAAIGAAEKQLAATTEQVKQAQANDEKAQKDLARYKMLVDAKEVSRQTYDSALAAAKASTATVAAAIANVEASRQAVEQARQVLAGSEASYRAAQTAPQQVAASRARALSAQATVEQKRAALEQAELNLLYTKIVAPVSGEVTKTVVPGLNVESGQQLLTVVPLDEVWITANFKETQLRHIRPGQRAQVYVDSTGRTYQGHVDSIAGATGPLFSLFPPENATGNYVKIVQRVPTKIVIEPDQNRDRQLRPGVNVTPKVLLR